MIALKKLRSLKLTYGNSNILYVLHIKFHHIHRAKKKILYINVQFSSSSKWALKLTKPEQAQNGLTKFTVHLSNSLNEVSPVVLVLLKLERIMVNLDGRNVLTYLPK
jgi:hypothetical protein